MSYVLQVYNPKYWDMKFDGTPYDDTPKKYTYLENWAKDKGYDIASNLCFFNFPSAKYFPLWTLQTLIVDGVKCGMGEASTQALITLPNGDQVCGWNENTRRSKKPLVESDTVYIPEHRNKSAHSLFGLTTDGRYIVCKSQKGYLQDRLASLVLKEINEFYKTHIIYLFEEDGGGSTGIYSVPSNYLFAPQREGQKGRKVTSAFLCKLKEEGKISRQLSYGMTGEDIERYQIILGGITADGQFGSDTRNRTLAVQRYFKIKQDGIAGPITLGKLGIWKG